MTGSVKIALCFPNFNWLQTEKMYLWNMFPDTLCILAATVRDICQVDIIDANRLNLSEDAFRERLAAEKYDMVGVSVLMDAFATAGHLAVSLAKQANPATVTVMGGVYPTMSPEHAMGNPDLDYVCIGEGEEVFPQLIRHVFSRENFPERGIARRDGGEVVIPPRAPLIDNLDALPFPAFDLVDYTSYTTWNPRKSVDGPALLPHIFMTTARGCPYSCAFCQASIILGRKIRVKSAEKVLDELEFFKTRYGIRSFTFVDDNTFSVRRRVMEILKGMIARKLVMPWKSNATAVFSLDEELLDLMAESGCKYICIAIESGSPQILKEVINKPVDLAHAKKMTAYAQSLGIYVSANFIVGFPGETWDGIRQTIRVAEEMRMDYMKLFSAIPLQHTKLWEMCERENAFAPDFDPYTLSWNKGQIISPHFDDRELTILRAYEWDRINFSTPEKIQATADMMDISVEELNATRRETRNAALAKLALATR